MSTWSDRCISHTGRQSHKLVPGLYSVLDLILFVLDVVRLELGDLAKSHMCFGDLAKVRRYFKYYKLRQNRPGIRATATRVPVATQHIVYHYSIASPTIKTGHRRHDGAGESD